MTNFPYTSQRVEICPKYSPFALGDQVSHLICGHLGPPESKLQTASQSVQSVVVGNVDDNSVSSCRLRASETQQLADATPSCCLCGVARGPPSTNDGPTCNTPQQHND